MAKKKREEKPKEYTRRQLTHFQKEKRRQRFIFIGGVSIIVAIILIVLLGWFLADYQPLHRTVIKVGDTRFSSRYYIDQLKLYAVSYQNQQADIDTLMQQIDSGLANNIVQNELIRQAAQPLGITVTDAEIKAKLQDPNQPVTQGFLDVQRTQQLETRLKDEYFSKQVPASEVQEHLLAMLVEDETTAQGVHDKIVNGDNFTELDKVYAKDYYSQNVNSGDYGWHPADIFINQMKQIPVDWAFSQEAGVVSPPLSDNESYKQVGYWLINVTDKLDEENSMVEAIYLSNQDLAVDVKARLEAGDNLTALSDQYNQYSQAKDKQGELGMITKSATANTTVVSAAFDGFVFGQTAEVGKWSDPIKDTTLWTQGGYWVVKVVERDNDKELTSEDRTSRIDKIYSDWVANLWTERAADISTSGMTVNVHTFVIARAKAELQATGG